MGIDEKVKRLLDAYDKNGYINGSILVASSDRIIVNKGYGFANREHKIPNFSHTKFRIGSLSKAFTSFAIYQLHKNGNLNINDAIGKYLVNYPNGGEITIYHCLTNTSGIPNFTADSDFWSSNMRLPLTLAQLIDAFKDKPLHFKPGNEFEYSNSGYSILTAVIEQVSNMPYAKYLSEYIFNPLGMVNTGCDDGRKVIAEMASGYSVWEEVIRAEYSDMSFPLGAYGLYSTVEDLFIWDKALSSFTILDEVLTKKMFEVNRSNYASGWVISNKFNKKCSHHYGDISGFCSNFLRFSEEKITVIYLSNLSITPVIKLTEEISEVMFGGSMFLPASIDAIGVDDSHKKLCIIGQYQVIDRPTQTISISQENNSIFLTVSKMYNALYKYKLIPVKQDLLSITFKTEFVNEELTIHYSPSNIVECVQYIDCYGEKHMAHNMKTYEKRRI